MQLRYVIFYVDDVDAALAFYERAFGLSRGFLHPSGDYGELATGGTKLAFSSRDLMRSLGKAVAAPDPQRPTHEIAFETGNVAAAYARALDAGADAVQAPRIEAWGQTTAYVRDGSGYLVEICSPVPSAGAD